MQEKNLFRGLLSVRITQNAIFKRMRAYKSKGLVRIVTFQVGEVVNYGVRHETKR